MPTLAHNIGATRDFPSRWKEPKPTDIAPLAAIIAAAGWPRATPATSEIAIATVQGREDHSRLWSQFTARLSRTTPRNIREHIARALRRVRDYLNGGAG